MAKFKKSRVHKVHGGTGPVKMPGMPGIQTAHASSTSTPTGPPHSFYGAPTQQGPPTIKKSNQGNPFFGTPTRIWQPSTPVVQQSTPPKRSNQPTVYATDTKTGVTQPLVGLSHTLTLQERQRYHEAGIKLSTRPPPETGYVGNVNMPDYLKDAYGYGETQPSNEFERGLESAGVEDPKLDTQKKHPWFPW